MKKCRRCQAKGQLSDKLCAACIIELKHGVAYTLCAAYMPLSS